MNTGNLIMLAIVLAPITYQEMRNYYAAQNVRHFRKKSGRTFVHEPLRHFI